MLRFVVATSLLASFATPMLAASAPPGGDRIQFQAGGLQRTAVVVRPARPTQAKVPMLLIFHGHGGSGREYAEMTEFHRHWPGAVCIYPDGLPSPGERDPEGRRPGWQTKAGQSNDRDLALFDTLVERAVKTYGVDPQRVYAAGFSNGGLFTYLLWSVRADKVRATAVCGAVCLEDCLFRTFSRKPFVAIHGSEDGRVPDKFAVQSMNAILGVNVCTDRIKEWPPGRTIKLHTPRPGGRDTMTIMHPGTHRWPDWATPDVVKFFTAH